MELELDSSSIGQSFEKVGESISEAQIKELQTLGPLDQNGELPPEKWLPSDPSQPSKGAGAATPLLPRHVPRQTHFNLFRRVS